jgi:hypothetical protein
MSNTSPLTPPSAILGKVALHQGAAVIAKLQFVYWDGGTWHHVDGTTALPLGSTVIADPGEFGVPDGAQFQPYVFVVLGHRPPGSAGLHVPAERAADGNLHVDRHNTGELTRAQQHRLTALPRI